MEYDQESRPPYVSSKGVIPIGALLKARLERHARAEGCDGSYLARVVLREFLDAPRTPGKSSTQSLGRGAGGRWASASRVGVESLGGRGRSLTSPVRMECGLAAEVGGDGLVAA
jgi:hypothetical protein